MVHFRRTEKIEIELNEMQVKMKHRHRNTAMKVFIIQFTLTTEPQFTVYSLRSLL